MKSVLVLSMMLCCALSAHAQWQPTTFNGGTFVLATNGTVLVASDTIHPDHMVQYSSDLGQTWHRSQNGPSVLDQLFARGTDFYGASATHNGTEMGTTFWRSTDNAHSWDSIGSLAGYG